MKMFSVINIRSFSNSSVPQFQQYNNESAIIALKRNESGLTEPTIKIFLLQTGYEEQVLAQNDFHWAIEIILDVNLISVFEKRPWILLKSSPGIQSKLNFYFTYFETEQQYDVNDCLTPLVEMIFKKNRNVLNEIEEIFKLIDYFQKNMDQSINTRTICTYMAMSKSTLSRLCEKHLKKRPIELLNEIRYRKAKHLLINSNESIKRIALEVGVRSFDYFSSFFKHHDGNPPSYYRKKKSTSSENQENRNSSNQVEFAE